MLLPAANALSNENTNTRSGVPSSYCSGRPHKHPQKQYRLMPLLDHTGENTTHFGWKAQRNKAGIDLEASTLLASFHNTRRCYAVHWSEADIYGTVQMWTLHDEMPRCPTTWIHVVWWSHEGNNRFLARFEDYFTRRNSCLCLDYKPGQKPMTGEVEDSSKVWCLSVWYSWNLVGQGISAEELSPSDCTVDKPVRHFLDGWLTWEGGAAHCRCLPLLGSWS